MPTDTQTTPPLPLSESQRARIAEICREFGVKKLSLFGSLARGEATPESDADFLYELAPGVKFGYITLETFAELVAKVLDRPWVDLVKPQLLNPVYANEVMRMARVIYEE